VTVQTSSGSAAGTLHTFEDWYRREHPRVLGAMYVLTRDRDMAGDATDEAFARALARWPHVSSMASPGAWVHRVALNVVRRTARRRGIEERILSRQRSRDVVPGDRPDVWDAVAALPLRQRTAIVLRFVADLPEADIALAMGINRGTVSSTLAAARRHLSEALQDDDDGGGGDELRQVTNV
jgi:RNA polymerase sigma factor (sigma-70 family)